MCQWIHNIFVFLLAIICINIKIIQCDENCTNSLSFKLPICPPGYTLSNGLCYLSGHVPMTSCPTGYQLYNNSFCYPLESAPCVPYVAPVYNRNPPTENIDESQPRCPTGSVFLQDKCRKLVCSQGEYYQGRCLQAACPDGMVWRGQRCQDPEYVITVVDIENVFVDKKYQKTNSEDIDVVLVTGSPLDVNIKTYFNKTAIIANNEVNSGELDIEINTQSPYYQNPIPEGNDIIYFNKTEIKPAESEELDIQVNIGVANELKPVVNQNMENVFNKTIIQTTANITQNLDVKVSIREPNTFLHSNEQDRTYFDKVVVSTSEDKLKNFTLNKTVDIKADNEAGSGDLDVDIIIGQPQQQNEVDIKNGKLADTTTTTTTTTIVPPVSSTTIEAITVSDNSTTCCTVYTPRICKQHGKRWLCFNRSYKLCDQKVCSHEVIYLKSPEIAYKSNMLIMPPNPPLPACAATDCDATTNCSGCTAYQRETCSSYCYRYLCPQDSCAYMDQQLFCTYYAGKFGCIERDGCIWNWCGVQN